MPVGLLLVQDSDTPGVENVTGRQGSHCGRVDSPSALSLGQRLDVGKAASVALQVLDGGHPYMPGIIYE